MAEPLAIDVWQEHECELRGCTWESRGRQLVVAGAELMCPHCGHEQVADGGNTVMLVRRADKLHCVPDTEWDLHAKRKK